MINKLEKSDGNKRVLVVDDEPEVRSMVEQLLKQLGYQVVVSSSGEEALQRLEEETVDLLFSDVVMPGGMNGYELAEQTALLYPKMKTLLTSGYSTHQENNAEQKKLTANLLAKPYTLSVLAERVHSVLHSDPSRTN